MIKIGFGEFPKDVVFAKLGKEMIKQVNGKYIQQKYGISNDKKIGQLIRDERIKWLKNYRSLNKLV